ncbi:hypothetical protein IFR05_009700 [Cadophora sp. M221]|nr:hypothetical protein IFR05_009700 [Cadophora sp. M221]
MAIKRSRSQSDEAMEGDSSMRPTKQVRFADCPQAPNRRHQLNSMSRMANGYEAADGNSSNRTANARDPQAHVQVTARITSSIINELDTRTLLFFLALALIFPRSNRLACSYYTCLGRLISNKVADTKASGSSPTPQSPYSSQNLNANFLVSGYEKRGPTPAFSRLLLSFPFARYLGKLCPIDRQIKLQVNRNMLRRISVIVKASSTLSDSEQKGIKERHGIEAGFMLVFKASKEDSKRAMETLLADGLLFGAPDLKVQEFIEESEKMMVDGPGESLFESSFYSLFILVFSFGPVLKFL